MPATFISRQKGLQSTVEILLSGRQPYSTYRSCANLLQYAGSCAGVLRETVDQWKVLADIGKYSRIFSASPASAASSQFYHHHTENLIPESNQIPTTSSLMAACSSFPQLGIRHFKCHTWKNGKMQQSSTLVDIFCKNKSPHYSSRVTGCLRDRQPYGNNMLYRCFWSNMDGTNSNSNPFVEPRDKNFHLSSLSPHSAGAAPDVSFDGSIREEQLENPAVSSDQKTPGERTLKLLSGSCYLPHPDKEETGGEDAHFICVDEQAIGVADGVGGWADLGVDAGQYARELMSNSVSAIQQEPKGSIDPARVLEKAYLSTKARGSSTACIIALTDQGIHAVNLGDSGFIVVRDGVTVFRSPVQQHDFNFTYQLECGQGSDLPSSAQVFTFPVAPGDVVIAGTDGLFDNLYNNEVTAVVVHAIRAGLGPQVTAQKIAALARQRAQDKNRQTPFSTAAQDAGYRYYGGKLDDITVVVSYITASNT